MGWTRSVTCYCNRVNRVSDQSLQWGEQGQWPVTAMGWTGSVISYCYEVNTVSDQLLLWGEHGQWPVTAMRWTRSVTCYCNGVNRVSDLLLQWGEHGQWPVTAMGWIWYVTLVWSGTLIRSIMNIICDQLRSVPQWSILFQRPPCVGLYKLEGTLWCFPSVTL